MNLKWKPRWELLKANSAWSTRENLKGLAFHLPKRTVTRPSSWVTEEDSFHFSKRWVLLKENMHVPGMALEQGPKKKKKKEKLPSLRSPGEIQGEKISFANPQILSIKVVQKKKITHYWKSIKPECDVHHRQSAKSFRGQKESVFKINHN